jgi:hypothetical protein
MGFAQTHGGRLRRSGELAARPSSMAGTSLFVRTFAYGCAPMLTQTSPVPEPRSDQRSDQRYVTRQAVAEAVYCYAVTASVEPSVLSRVIELFTLRDLIPAAVSCRQVRRNEPELRIDVEVSGLDAQHAEHLALRMRNMLPVISVLLDVRTA